MSSNSEAAQREYHLSPAALPQTWANTSSFFVWTNFSKALEYLPTVDNFFHILWACWRISVAWWPPVCRSVSQIIPSAKTQIYVGVHCKYVAFSAQWPIVVMTGWKHRHLSYWPVAPVSQNNSSGLQRPSNSSHRLFIATSIYQEN